MQGSRLASWVLAAAGLLAAGPAAAQESGLLLGLSTPDSSGKPYHTLWIAPEAGRIRVLAAGPDLLVPRRSGFWRVCLVSGQDLSEGRRSEWDSLIARPATSTRGPCVVPTGKPVEEVEDGAGEEGGGCTASVRTEILFLGTDAASIEQHEESDCGAHYSGGTHTALTSLDNGSPLKLTAFLDPPGRAALLSATLKAAGAEFGDLGRVDTLDSDPDDTTQVAHLRVLREWAVERGAGRWQTVGHTSCSPYVACGDGLRRFSVPGFAAPARLVGHDGLSPPLQTIKMAFPAVEDAVSSPRGDLVVALTGDSLLVFGPRSGRLGAPVLRLPLSGRILMAQWAVGRFVPVWTAQLRRLLTSN